MENVAPKAIAVGRVLDEVLRRDRGRLLAGLISRLGDFGLAEDALQDASIAALKHWSRTGAPHNPMAWLMKVGLNKGIDRIRTGQRESQKSDSYAQNLPDPGGVEAAESIPDERLRLIFTCCHPGLEEKSRIALTLRTVCNLTTREIAAAFLDTEQTMGQRLSRAKAKIKSKGISFSVPEPEMWPSRLETVLATLHLIFTTGYVTEDSSSRDLCLEGIFLVRLLRHLCPDETEIEGALALMLFTDARRAARVDESGAMVPVDAQNTGLWKQDYIAEAQDILTRAMEKRHPGPFQIKAALADCHMMRPTPDWVQMSLLYQSLWGFEPTPVVALNWAVVIAETGQAELAMAKLDALEDQLRTFQPWHAGRAHVLERLGRRVEAAEAYQTAIKTAPNAAAQNLLRSKLARMQSV